MFAHIILKYSDMKKKLILLLATLTIVVNAWCQTFESGGINFKITSTSPATVEVTRKNSKYSGSITIPATTENGGTNYAVTAIGEWAFYVCDKLTRVSIPSSVTAIGDHAFKACSGLTSFDVDHGNTQYASKDGVLFDKQVTTLHLCSCTRLLHPECSDCQRREGAAGGEVARRKRCAKSPLRAFSVGSA
jgi:hypothetical protein